MYQVFKNNKLRFEGSNFKCFKYILDNQSQSVHWAERYGGWRLIKKKG